MKREYVWLVQVKRFHCPIRVFFISLQALTEVLFSFAVSPFGCYCSGKLFCTGFTCAFVIALTLHGSGEGGNGGYWSWASLGSSSEVLGQLLLKVGVWPFNSTHFLFRLECLVLGQCVPCCMRKRPTVCIRCVFHGGILLQITTATAVVVERRQNTTSKNLWRSTPRCAKTLGTPPSQTASHKSIYERQSLPFRTIQ